MRSNAQGGLLRRWLLRGGIREGRRIVNFRVNQGTSIYLYDLEGKVLYYASKSLNKKFQEIFVYTLILVIIALKKGKFTSISLRSQILL